MDGTGPLGRGPMTGGGKGFCMFKAPASDRECVTGFAGRSGRPVAMAAGLRPPGFCWARSPIDAAGTGDRKRRVQVNGPK